MQFSERFQIKCSNGEIVVSEDDLLCCDYLGHLVNGQKKLNLLNNNETINSSSKPKYTIESGKLYPVEVIQCYFELFLHQTVQPAAQIKLEHKPTCLILQILGFLFSDGRGEIYNSQKDAIGMF